MNSVVKKVSIAVLGFLIVLGIMTPYDAFAGFSSFGGRSFSSSSRSFSSPSRSVTPTPSPKIVTPQPQPPPPPPPKPVIVYKPVAPTPQKPIITQVPKKPEPVMVKKVDTPKPAPIVMNTAPEKKERRRVTATIAKEPVQTNTIIHETKVVHDSGSFFTPMLMGGAIGYMLGGHNNNSHASQMTQEEAAKYPTCPDPVPEGWNTPCIVRPHNDVQQPAATTVPQTTPVTPSISGSGAVANTGITGAIAR